MWSHADGFRNRLQRAAAYKPRLPADAASQKHHSRPQQLLRCPVGMGSCVPLLRIPARQRTSILITRIFIGHHAQVDDLRRELVRLQQYLKVFPVFNFSFDQLFDQCCTNSGLTFMPDERCFDPLWHRETLVQVILDEGYHALMLIGQPG